MTANLCQYSVMERVLTGVIWLRLLLTVVPPPAVTSQTLVFISEPYSRTQTNCLIFSKHTFQKSVLQSGQTKLLYGGGIKFSNFNEIKSI